MKDISLLGNLKKTINVIKVIYASSKGFFFVFIGQAIVTSVFPYVTIFFTYLIIDGIVDNISKTELMSYVYWMIGLNLALGIITNILTYYNSVYSVELNYNLDNKIASKTFELDYALIEDNETMKMIEMAEEGCNGNGGTKYYCEYVLSGILSSVLSIVYGTILLSGLLLVVQTTNNSILVNILNNPWSTLIIIFGLFIPAIISKYIMKKNNERSYEIMMLNINGNRKYGYFMQICRNYKYGKDIRLFHMQDMFIDKMTNFRLDAEKPWREFSIYKTSYFEHNCISSLLSVLLYLPTITI